MNKRELIEISPLIAIVGVTIAFLGWVILVGVPDSNQREGEFMDQCIRAGGLPSRYETMVGKQHQHERLCIKRESVVEVER